MHRLTKFNHKAFLVGGGVRDILLGKKPKDFDIATSATPNQIKNIFNNSYQEATDGWIKKLNQKVLDKNSIHLEHKIVFINYNYDHVLDDNFLNYEYLPTKHSRLTYKPRLQNLSRVSVKTLCPHGTLFPKSELKRTSHLEKYCETIKTDDTELLDAVSCYESKTHSVKGYSYGERKLYILGLGGGLKINFSNINFELPVSEIHVTVKDKKYLTDIVNFLAEKFNLPVTGIKVYDTCKDLIEKCF
jgi:hypothetical protein